MNEIVLTPKQAEAINVINAVSVFNGITVLLDEIVDAINSDDATSLYSEMKEKIQEAEAQYRTHLKITVKE